MDIRENFLMMRMARHWNRLSRKIVDVPSSEWFKVMLNEALRTLV